LMRLCPFDAVRRDASARMRLMPRALRDASLLIIYAALRMPLRDDFATC